MDDKPAPTSGSRVIFAGLIGNVMEWYDFAVYGYFASIIGRQFFPSDNPSVSLIAAFGAFAAGFLVRPLGECGFALGIGLLSGGAAGANVELMPNAIRCTGLAFAYNASIGLFGGTTPLIAACLISITGNPISPAYWVTAACAVSLLTAIFFVRETSNQSLE